MPEPLIAIGIGATKAGTSWLYRHLRTHPECGFRAIKELHYFDMLDQPPNAWGRRRLQRRRRAMAEKAEAAEPREAERLAAMIADFDDWLEVQPGSPEHSAYLDYLHAGAAGRRLVGEVTPAYALLPAPRLAEIARLSERVRLVYLLRDPVDRLWSNAKMAARLQDMPSDTLPARSYAAFDAALAGEAPDLAARSDYAGTLARLGASVPMQQIHLAFYETMFTPEGLKRITDYLGISEVPAAFQNRLDPTADIPLDPARRRRAAQQLAPQYEAVEAALDQPLPERWRHHLSLEKTWFQRLNPWRGA